jgi:hypothetical protein
MIQAGRISSTRKETNDFRVSGHNNSEFRITNSELKKRPLHNGVEQGEKHQQYDL